jgi:LAO/AO transport system kinase
VTPALENWRVKLARELSARAKMTAAEAIHFDLNRGVAARRVGITGPPGAGKSTLIAHLVEQWLAAGSKVGVLAIDPTSPFSGGSLLGDRVRMDHLSGTESAFIRSIPSRSSTDGLCPNIMPLLAAFDDAGFDEVILETVGIGQVSYGARYLVDTFVLVLVPESGDTIQAMKAGIIETADICVVNKADRPGAEKLISELRSIAKWRAKWSDWKPPVLPIKAADGSGVSDLIRAIDEHRAHFSSTDRQKFVQRSRRNFHLKSTVQRQLDEIIESFPDAESIDGTQLYRRISSELVSPAPTRAPVSRVGRCRP